ncbi:salicylate synthase [Salmonella enterica]|nr:salicylate synthase [Salmonella enterica]
MKTLIKEKPVNWPDITLGSLLSLLAKQFAGRPAVCSGPDKMTYFELADKSDRFANYLHQAGVRTGDNVLLQLPNSIGFLVALFGLFRLGARPVLAMPTQGENDLLALCQSALPRMWIHTDRYLVHDFQPLSMRLSECFPTLQQVVVSQADDPDCTLSAFCQCVPLNQQDVPTLDAGETALLLLSGGSTGTPKLIPRTHADYLYNAGIMAEICRINSDTVYLAALSAAHNFTLACPGILGVLQSGGKVVMAQTSSCDETFPLIEQHRVTLTSLVPPLLAIWLECRSWDESDLSSLKLLQVGGARLESTLAARVEPELGCQLQQVFGMAEGLICCTRLDDAQEVIIHTQGRPASQWDRLRVVNAENHDVGIGETGELLIQGPYTITGYYRAPQQNLTSFTQAGEYRSGDLVRLTAEGNVIVEGRIKEQINRAGEKISCAELEECIARHPDIENCIVVGVKDSVLGERICACLSGHYRISLAELRVFLLQQGISNFKLPDQLLSVSNWPVTPVGKIDRRQLTMIAQQQTNDIDLHLTSLMSDQRLDPTSSIFDEEMPLHASPLDVACNFLAKWPEKCLAYEKGSCWHIGFDALAEIHLYKDHCELMMDGKCLRFTHQHDYLRSLQQALDALPFSRWRALGVGDFELSYLFHDLPAQVPAERPLLQLLIPRFELMLTEGKAYLQAQNSTDLTLLCQQLIAADHIYPPVELEPGRHLDVRERLSLYDSETYKQQVKEAVEDIQRGEYQKIILSRRICLDESLDLVASYHFGRRHNTPARSFLVNFNNHQFMGFSPETIVESTAQGILSTQPLAGTRALTANEQENTRLRDELTNDTKEIAEHAVSVKLAFDELLQVCVPDSVSVQKFMHVLPRGTVQHLASQLQGTLAEGRNCWDGLKALFPAVTASGIPKRAALEAIAAREAEPRGAYSGTVLMLDSDGTLDAALVLRSLYRLENGFALQAGAGIVEQSQPVRECTETLEKLQSIGLYLLTE